MNCKDCKHEDQICQSVRIGECGSFTPKPETRPPQKPLTIDEIIKLDIRLALENMEFVINNQNQLLKAIKFALQNNPDNRPVLEKILLDCVAAIQDAKEKEMNLLVRQAEIQK